MRLKTILVSIILITSLLFSCRNTSNSIDRSLSKKWLNDLVCEFPCWQYITPLNTSFEDATSILQQDQDIQVDFIGKDDVSFQSTNFLGSIDKTPDGRVKSIVLSIKGLILGDVLDVIGLPENLVIAKDLNPERCLVSMMFPEKGTILDLYLKNNASGKGCQTEIKSDSEIFRILLVETNPSHDYALEYIEWEGYGNYP